MAKIITFPSGKVLSREVKTDTNELSEMAKKLREAFSEAELEEIKQSLNEGQDG